MNRLFCLLSLAASLAVCVSGHNLAVVNLFTTGVKLTTLNVDGNEIIGIARLDDKLYVVCVMNDTIFVFKDRSPYKRIALLKIPALAGMGPGDVIADCIAKRLYIIDWRPASAGGTRVWSVDPVTQTATYYVNGTHWTGTLSLTPARKVLGVSGTSKLNLYSASSGLTVLPLPNGTIDPQHAIRDNGGFYVSVGWTSGQPHRILHVDSTGTTVLHHYGASVPGNGTGQLNWPRYVAEGPAGHVFLIDYWNRRVLKFDETLSTSSVLLDPTNSIGFGWPERLLVVAGRRNKFGGSCGSRSPRFSTLFVAMSENPLSW